MFDNTKFLWTIVLVGMLGLTAQARYLPGMSPAFYKEGELVRLTVHSLRSTRVLFPYDYYSLPFCRPAPIEDLYDSLGEIIWGDRKHNSLYTFPMLVNSSCSVLACDQVTNFKNMTDRAVELKAAIDRGYRGFMSIDNLPVFNNGTVECERTQKRDFQRGYALGTSKDCTGETLLNNHIHFKIYYNSQPTVSGGGQTMEYMVVGLNAIPHSVLHENITACKEGQPPVWGAGNTVKMSMLTAGSPNAHEIYWTYSYEWLKSDVLWASRWDAYFSSSASNTDTMTHAAYITFSGIAVLLIAGSVATVLMRALRLDIARYNSLDAEELQEETGWKLIHADVFRPPDRAPLLSVLAGSGAQVMVVVTSIILLSVTGFLSPSRRGSLLYAVLVTSIMSTFVGGYVCGLLQRYWNCKEWKYVTLSGTLLPGMAFLVFTLANMIGRAVGATTALSVGAYFLLATTWLLISLPLIVLGASFAFHQEPMKNPIPVGRLAREIPVQPLVSSPKVLFLLTPMVPLCTVLLEIQFIMQALWAGQVYYVFWYFLIACFLWLVVSVLASALALYYVLCYENHQWWWPAFTIPACFGLHLFLYAVIFFFSQLSITAFTSTMLYFLYMGVISLSYGLAGGAVGLFTGIVVTRTMYGSIKTD